MSRDALLAAVAAQRALRGQVWPGDALVQVRMGVHTGEPVRGAEGYVGMDVHRAARICSAGQGGQILLSATTRDLVVDSLPEGMGLLDLGEHRLKDLARPLRLFQVVVPDLPAGFPRLRSLDALPHNLPVELTSFVGREREKTELERLLSATRLLTLTGSAGAGKTRLALQVAAEIVDDFPDGVWFVELAPISDPALVPQTVASVLGVAEEPVHPLLDTLGRFIGAKSLLLVLDNCEHLISGCAHLAHALLRKCANLRILSTSREALGVDGETSWRVPSLSLPEPTQHPRPDTLARYESVQLFRDRASAAYRDFTLSDNNAAAIADICHRLDGVPLAIELAAARVKALSPEQIAKRLDDRFRLLRTESHTTIPRHQTLRSTIDWSYELLSEQEKRVLHRLSVFIGGFMLEAAEDVCPGEE